MSTLIRNMDLLKQPIDYADIIKPPLAPTDIDGVIEWKGLGCIFLECKQKGKGMDAGQKLMYERLVQNNNRAKQFAVAVLFEHEEYDSSKPIIAWKCKVKEIYGLDDLGTYSWFKPEKDTLVKDFIIETIKYINVSNGYPEDYGDFLQDA